MWLPLGCLTSWWMDALGTTSKGLCFKPKSAEDERLSVLDFSSGEKSTSHALSGLHDLWLLSAAAITPALEHS